MSVLKKKFFPHKGGLCKYGHIYLRLYLHIFGCNIESVDSIYISPAVFIYLRFYTILTQTAPQILTQTVPI